MDDLVSAKKRCKKFIRLKSVPDNLEWVNISAKVSCQQRPNPPVFGTPAWFDLDAGGFESRGVIGEGNAQARPSRSAQGWNKKQPWRDGTGWNVGGGLSGLKDMGSVLNTGVHEMGAFRGQLPAKTRHRSGSQSGVAPIQQ